MTEGDIWLAVKTGNSDLLKQFIQEGIYLNLFQDGLTLLHWAALDGHLDCVKLLLDGGANVDVADEYGRTPLCIAAQNGHVDCVKLLVESGANVDLADERGLTPLYWVARRNCCVDCVKLLLDRGANVDTADEDGRTPLYWAANKGHACVKLLLEGGANVYVTSRRGFTPLTKANGKKHVVSMAELIAFGALVNYRASLFGSNPCATRDKEGRTVLHYLVEKGTTKQGVLNVILAYPKAVDIQDNNGKTPLDIALKIGADVSVQWLLFQYHKVISNGIMNANPLLSAATRMTRRTIQSVHVHLVGHGYAGKTTCRLALNKTLKHLNPLMFGLFGDHKDVSVDRSNGAGKTEGMEMDSIESPNNKWLIRDYGGQADFHVNHARFLSVPGSIYVIVVALWDEEKFSKALLNAKRLGRNLTDEERQCEFNVEEIKNRYVYWLKFLNSIAEKGTTMNCITVINFGEKVSRQCLAVSVAIIKQSCSEWLSTPSSVRLHGDPCVLSVCRVNEVRQLNVLLQLAADNSRHENSIPILRYIDTVETIFSDYVRTSNSRMDRKTKFIESVCLPAVCSLLAIEGPLPTYIKHVDFVYDKMIECLCASGKIIVVPTSTSSDDPLIVLDVNWLSKELLGGLINKLSQSGRDEFVLTAKEINSFTNNGSGYFGGVDGLVSFLESIGACIAVPDGDSVGEVKRWFPLCGQRKFVIGRECVAMEKGVWVSFRKVVRLFILSDPKHQMFPSGYFIDLFLKILSLYSLKRANTLKVFINGMDVEYQFNDSVLQILFVVQDDNCGFSLEMSFASTIAASTNVGEFWKRFKMICEVIISPKEVYAAGDIIRVSPWFDNVKLTEKFVNPTMKAYNKAQQDLNETGMSMNVVELRNTMTMDDLEDRDVSIQNLYIYGCNESDMPVNGKDPPRHILAILLGKVDQLSERWNTVTVTVSSDLIQESFKVMMNTLKDSMSTELRDMIETSRQAMCEDSLSMSNLQSVVDKLRSDIGEKITRENAQVLTELNQMQESMKELTDEVHNIQHLNDKALQSAILNAFNESKTLLRIDCMMQTMLKGTHDVPTMAIVIPVVKEGFTFNPSDWASYEYSLYFVCSHSHQVVACGPDGKGYRFRRAKEWLKKVAPVIKVCLIAAKIALTISGIPIPISGVTESLDQITEVAETAKYLKTALSVVDAASDTADALGVAVGDQGSGVKDKSLDSADQYVNSLEDLLKRSDTIEAYKSLKVLLDKVDPSLSSVGLEKVTSASGKTEWVKKGDQDVIDSFMRDEKWPMKIDELKESYNGAVAAVSATPEVQSKLGSRSGLWLPKSLFGKRRIEKGFRFLAVRRTINECRTSNSISQLARLDFKIPSVPMSSFEEKSSESVEELTEKIAKIKVANNRVKIDKAAARTTGKQGKQVEKRRQVLESIDEIEIDIFNHRSENLTIEHVRSAIRQLGFVPYNMVEVAAFSKVDPTHPFVMKTYPLATNEVGGRYKSKEPLPFPTMFWMSSPELHAKIGHFEVDGMITVFEERLRSSPEYLDQMESAHKSYAAERWAQLTDEEKEMSDVKGWSETLRDKGVAGIKDFTTVKCLHTHYAHYLARPEHGNLLGMWVHELLENDRAMKGGFRL